MTPKRLAFPAALVLFSLTMAVLSGIGIEQPTLLRPYVTTIHWFGGFACGWMAAAVILRIIVERAAQCPDVVPPFQHPTATGGVCVHFGDIGPGESVEIPLIVTADGQADPAPRRPHT